MPSCADPQISSEFCDLSSLYAAIEPPRQQRPVRPPFPFFEFPRDVLDCIFDHYVSKAKTPRQINRIKAYGVSKAFDWELQGAIIRRLRRDVKSSGDTALAKIRSSWLTIYLASQNGQPTSRPLADEAPQYTLHSMVEETSERMAMELGTSSLSSPLSFVEAIYASLRFLCGWQEVLRMLKTVSSCPLYDDQWIRLLAAVYLDSGELLGVYLDKRDLLSYTSDLQREQLCKLMVQRQAFSAIRAFLARDHQDKWCNTLLYKAACDHGKPSFMLSLLEIEPPVHQDNNVPNCYLGTALDHVRKGPSEILLEHAFQTVWKSDTSQNMPCHKRFTHKLIFTGNVRLFKVLLKVKTRLALQVRHLIIENAIANYNMPILQELINSDLLCCFNIPSNARNLDYFYIHPDAERLIRRAIYLQREALARLLIEKGFMPTPIGLDPQIYKLITGVTLLPQYSAHEILREARCLLPDEIDRERLVSTGFYSGNLSAACRLVFMGKKQWTSPGNWGRFSPLHWAILEPCHELMRICLERGDEQEGPDFVPEIGGCKYEISPLTLAIQRNDRKAVGMLIKHLADPLLEKGGVVPLKLAQSLREQESKLDGSKACRQAKLKNRPQTIADMLEAYLARQKAERDKQIPIETEEGLCDTMLAE